MDADDDADREARRKARASWPMRKFALGEEPPDDLSHLSPDERVSLVWEVALAAWLLSGNVLTDLPRSQWPGKVVRSA